MRPSIVQLRQFYSSRLGRKVKQRLRLAVVERWAEQSEEPVIGIGYTPPIMRVLERSSNAPSLALMPANQGAIYWPVHSTNRSLLADELMPPFAPNTLHRVLMLHAFEHVVRPNELLAVYWQMLAPGGRLLLLIPNRRSYWSSFSHTPFARGTPYSMAQVKELLAEANFTLRDSATILYGWPGEGRIAQTLWGALEWVGSWCFPGFGGVLIVEAEKQIYASVPEMAASRVRKWASANAPVSAA